jgi:hypothetical protein
MRGGDIDDGGCRGGWSGRWSELSEMSGYMVLFLFFLMLRSVDVTCKVNITSTFH